MKTLLAYATYSSGTQTASLAVAEELTKQGHTVERKNIHDITPDELNQYDLIILASPSWLNDGKEGQPHEYFLHFIETMQGKELPGKLFAIFGLGDTAYMNFCGAVDHLEAFVKSVKGKLVIESLRIDGFYYSQAHNTDLLKSWAHKLAQAL